MPRGFCGRCHRRENVCSCFGARSPQALRQAARAHDAPLRIAAPAAVAAPRIQAPPNGGGHGANPLVVAARAKLGRREPLTGAEKNALIMLGGMFGQSPEIDALISQSDRLEWARMEADEDFIQRMGEAQIVREHLRLINGGYVFVGYHGCSSLDAEAMLRTGLDERKSGANAGSDRGAGLYVAREYSNAESFADGRANPGVDESQFAGDSKGLMAEIAYWENHRDEYRYGHPQVLRIYALKFDIMVEGYHFVWGKMGRHWSAGAYNTELVFKFCAYSKLACLPSLGPQRDAAVLSVRMAPLQLQTVHEAVPQFDFKERSRLQRRNSTGNLKKGPF